MSVLLVVTLAIIASGVGLHVVAKQIKHQPVEFVDWLVLKCFWLGLSLLAGTLVCALTVGF